MKDSFNNGDGGDGIVPFDSNVVNLFPQDEPSEDDIILDGLLARFEAKKAGVVQETDLSSKSERPTDSIGADDAAETTFVNEALLRSFLARRRTEPDNPTVSDDPEKPELVVEIPTPQERQPIMPMPSKARRALNTPSLKPKT